MKKILSVLLVLAMVLSMVPVSVTAAGTVEASPKAGTHQTTGHTCEDEGCGETNWLPWPTTGTLPTEGHYYLTQNMEQTQMVSVPAGKSLHLCLNGYVIEKTTTNRLFSVSAAGAELVITDCTAYTDDNGVYRAGAITGGVNTGDSGGGAVFVYADATLKLYDGIITGNIHKNDSAGGGAIALRKKDDSHTRGGKFCMYGGEITNNYSFKTNGTTPIYGGAIYANTGSEVEINGGKIAGNTGANGGAIYATAATVSVKNAEITGNTGSTGNIALYKKSALTMENVTMAGNTAKNGSAIYAEGGSSLLIKDCTITGNEGTAPADGERRSAAIYVVSATLTLSGKNVIADNITTLATVPDVVLDNASYDTLYIKDVTEGSRVVFATPQTAAVDAKEVIALNADKKQTEPWQSGWIRYMAADGSLKDVGLVNEEFVWGHYHGTQAYTALENADQLIAGGHYYLADNVKLDKLAALSTSNMTLDLCLNGHDLTPADGQQILKLGNKSIKATIDDCTAYTDASGVYHAGSLTGVNTTSTGGAIYVGGSDTLYLRDGKLSGNTAGNAAGVILYGTMYMYGGEISNNVTTKNGAGIYVGKNAGELYVYGGTITGNTAVKGAGVFVGENAVMEVKDAAITGNTASDYAGGILAGNGATVTLSGNVQINKNKTGANADNLYLQDVTLTLNALDSKAKIGITLDPDRITGNQLTFTETLTNDPSACFTSDDTNYKVELVNNKLTLVENNVTPPPAATHTHCVCGDLTCTEHEQVTYEPWGNNPGEDKKLPDSGKYYLTTDVTVEETIEYAAGANKNLHLCLHGKTITQKAGTNAQMFNSKADANVTITISDCQASGSGDTYSAGKITGFTGPATGGTEGGVMYLRYGTTLNLYDGIISNNQTPAKSGGAILTNGVFNMYGGLFLGNTAGKTGNLKNGGAVYLNSDAVFTMTGGVFKDNTGGNGGAIHCNHAEVTISNATFTGNSANQGGALSTSNDTTLVLRNSVLNGNTAATEGGAVAVTGSDGKITTLRLENCTITGNTATTGGVSIRDYAELTLAGKNIITGNQGGNLRLNPGRVFSLDNFSTESSIGVSADDPGRAISTDCANFATNFTSDNVDYTVKHQGGKLHLVASFTHTHCVCGDTTCTQHQQVSYNPWTDSTKLPDSGNYCLMTNVTVEETINYAAGANKTLNLCLHGKTITQKSGTNAQMFNSATDANVTITISDCQASGSGDTYSAGKITGFVMNGVTEGSTMYLRKGTTLNIYDGIFTDNMTIKKSAGVIMMNGVLNMYNGQFSNNFAGDGTYYNGGAIYLNKDSVATITGGVFKNNTGKQGGAIYMGRDNNHTIENVAFIGNEATEIGGALALGNGIGDGIKLKNCVFENNSASQKGGAVRVPGVARIEDCTFTGNQGGKGAVYMSDGGDLTLAGNNQITGNTPGNLYLEAAETVKVESATGTVGVTLADPGRAFTEACADYTANFTSDDAADYKVTYQDGKLWLVTTFEHKHCVCGDAACTQHGTVEFQPWKDSTKLPDSGNYCLLTDVTLSGECSIKGDLTLCLHGKTITTTAKKRLVGLPNADVTLTITDCTAKTENGVYTAGKLTGGTDSSAGGGAVFVRAGSTLKLYNGIITDNMSTIGGGAVLLQSHKNGMISSFYMYGGEISNNSTTAKSGGGVYAYQKSVFVMEGGVIKDNEAGTGGGIHASNARLTLGGEISGNKAATSGGVNMENGTTLTLTGKAVITGNTAGTKASNLCLYGNQKIKAEKLDKAAKVAVSGQPLTFFTDKCDDYSANFLSDNSKYQVVYQDGAMYLDAAGNHKHCLCAATSQYCDHSVLTFVEWDDPTSLPTSGNYYLSVDVELPSQKYLEDTELNLCLNGHTIKVTGDQTRAYYTKGDAILRITDCNEKPGVITGGTKAAIVTENVAESEALIELYNGILTGNENVSLGGAVQIQGGTTFNMYGGKITGNSLPCALKLDKNGEPALDAKGNQTYNSNRGGGAVGLYGAHTVFHMYGGEITGNKTNSVIYLTNKGKESTAGGFGGGIFAEKGSVYIHGGLIANNTTDRTGGGMFVQSGGLIEITGGEISNNTCGASGGGFYASSNSTVNIYGGTIAKNNAKNAGGFYANTGSKITMTGGKVINNASTSSGAGIMLSGKGVEMTMTGGEVTGNRSEGSAGGILAQSRATLNLKNVKITKNYCKGTGGGVYISKNSFFTMEGGSISNNSAKGGSGGLHMAAKATGKITGGSVSYNQTEGPAGGVRLSGATLTASGLSIIGNTSAKSGCGLWVGGTTITENGVTNPAYSTVNLYGCTISNNSAEGSAAGILFQSKGTVANMSGCTVSGNKGTNSGGGLYVSSNVTVTIKNSKFIGNESKNGAGMRINNCLLATLENVEVKDNTATSSGAGMYVGGANLTAVLKDLDISGNSGTSAGGILVTSSAPNVKLLDSKIYNNTAYSTSGGGINIGSYSVVEASNLDIFGNKAETSSGGIYVGAGAKLVAENISVHENSTNGFGGGALLGGDVTMTNCSFTKNSAKDYGGGVATHTGGGRTTGLRAGAKLIDCQISNNTAGTMGGGLYVHRGGPAALTNVEITNNTSDMEGGGIYSDGKMKLTDVSVTDNTSGGTGYAVYLTPADSDGHTYYAGYKSIRGNMIIQDNIGGDVYMDTGIPLVIEGALGDNSTVQVTLSDGVLTQRVFGVYHYEGEGLNYTLTAGDRSITEPMAPEGDAADADNAGENVLLYVSIGVFVIAVAAVVVLLVLKKKKAGIPAEEASKE